jgi:hypothetical protein
MTKMAPLFFLACLIIFNASVSSAEEPVAPEYGESHTALDNKESAIDIPPGMELRKVGSISMIVPEGTQVSRKNSLVVMEGPDEYAARNIYEMKGRLMALEAQQHDLKKELDDLRETILKLQKTPEEQLK